MPRRKTLVKTKSIGAIDIHFHGAFGIDLMSASPARLDELALRLAQRGVAGFCATTLSIPFPRLRESVRRLGEWIRSKHPSQTGALPLGIHLEGPYISPGACGAHPPDCVRPPRLAELEQLWIDSRQTLKIVTIAPERLSAPTLRNLTTWAARRRITLSVGHSRATEAQARRAFDAGFGGVTHAWNALAFHHREAGVLGAALGRRDVSIELILDQLHLSPTLLRWTRGLHGSAPLCYVSDCAPAAATSGGWHPFGHLKTRYHDGACRLAGGHLAGGGVLLPEAFARWVEREARDRRRPARDILREQLPHVTLDPLKHLSLGRLAPALLRYHAVDWVMDDAGESPAIRIEPRF